MVAKALGAEVKYKTAWDVTAEIAEKVTGYSEVRRKTIRKVGLNRDAVPTAGNGTAPAVESAAAPAGGALKLRVAEYLFCHDKILDAESNLAHQFRPSTVHLHASDAEKLGVKADQEVTVTGNGHEVKAEVVISNRCNPGSAVLPRVSDEQRVAGLIEPGQTVAWVQIRK